MAHQEPTKVIVFQTRGSVGWACVAHLYQVLVIWLSSYREEDL